MRFRLLFLLLSALGMWLFFVRVTGIVLNLRSREYVTEKIHRAEKQIAAEMDIEITETFYTRNVSYEGRGVLQIFVLDSSKWLDPTYLVGFWTYRLFFRGKPFSDVQYVIPEEFPRGNTL